MRDGHSTKVLDDLRHIDILLGGEVAEFFGALQQRQNDVLHCDAGLLRSGGSDADIEAELFDLRSRRCSCRRRKKLILIRLSIAKFAAGGKLAGNAAATTIIFASLRESRSSRSKS